MSVKDRKVSLCITDPHLGGELTEVVELLSLQCLETRFHPSLLSSKFCRHRNEKRKKICEEKCMALQTCNGRSMKAFKSIIWYPNENSSPVMNS
jgi:hypothetical protein